MRIGSPTANERFKRRSKRLGWIAAAFAVAAHIGVFVLIPPLTIDSRDLPGFRPRMVLTVANFASPPCPGPCRSGYAAFDTTMTKPQVLNLPELTGRLPRLYPRLLWTYHEPSHGVVRVTVRRSGHVEDASLLASRGNGADDALLELVRRIRFAPPELPDSAAGLILSFEVSVEPPI